MLRTLLETRRPASRDRGGAALSVVVHAGVIAATVAATATADAHVAPVRPQSVIFTAEPPTHPPTTIAAPAHTSTSTTTVTSPSVPVISVEVPSTLPDIGSVTTVAMPSTEPWTPAGNLSSTTTSGTPGNGIWSEHTVEKPVIALGDTPRPRYPELLRSAGVEGEVLAQFVVDTTGRVEVGSLRVLRSSHALFTQAIERVIPLARFVPAEAGGRRVRQLVQQPFSFAIQH